MRRKSYLEMKLNYQVRLADTLLRYWRCNNRLFGCSDSFLRYEFRHQMISQCFKRMSSYPGNQNLNCSMVVKVIDMHTGGGPVRIAVSGYPEVTGDTILEKKRYAEQNLDHIRRLLMQEPRGHEGMHGVMLVPCDKKEADMAVLFIHNQGFGMMCSHASMGLGRYAVDHGIVKAVSQETVVRILSPCGLLTANVNCEDGRSGTVRVRSSPCFVFATDLTINLAGYGKIHYHISNGGNYYIYTDVTQFGLDITSSPGSDLIVTAGKLKAAVADSIKLSHPENGSPAKLTGVFFYSNPLSNSSDAVSELCIYEKMICRSPCGSGISGLLALLHHKGLINTGEVRRFINTKTQSYFDGKVTEQVNIKETPAVITEMLGKAHYTGESTFYCEQDDPQPSFCIS